MPYSYWLGITSCCCIGCSHWTKCDPRYCERAEWRAFKLFAHFFLLHEKHLEVVVNTLTTVWIGRTICYHPNEPLFQSHGKPAYFYGRGFLSISRWAVEPYLGNCNRTYWEGAFFMYGAFGGYTRWAVVFLIIFVLFILIVPGYGDGAAGAAAAGAVY